MTGTVGFCLALLALALGVGLGWSLARRSLAETLRALETAQRDARSDPLTGLWNRKAFDEHLVLLTAIARRYKGAVSLALFDLDGFKQINDRHGHAAGDAALVQFARVLRDSLRASDFFSRIGGDEFAVLLPYTDLEGAGVLAERIVRNLEAVSCQPAAGSLREHENRPVRAAVANVARASAGVAELRPEESPAQLVERADRALYASKAAGGGRVAGLEAPLHQLGPRQLGPGSHRSSDSSTR